MVQWLGLGAFTAAARVSIPGQGTKIPQAAQHGQTPPPANKQTNKQLFIVKKYWLSLNSSVSNLSSVFVSKETRQKSGVGSTSFAVG